MSRQLAGGEGQPTPMSGSPRARVRWHRAADELAAGAAAAILSAALHLLAVRLIDLPFTVYRWAWRSGDLIWKLPLAYGLVFVPVALTLAVLAASLPRGVPLRASLAVWITLAAWAVLCLFPQVNGWVWLLVAGGMGIRLSQPLASRAGTVRQLLRGGALACVVAALATRPLFERREAEREAKITAGLPEPRAGAPNVLLLVWDTARAASLSLYGSTAPTTPHLDSIARAGVVFENAHATAPWTLPSHASMFRGQYASRLGAGYSAALDDRGTTLAEALRDAGYATAGFTANFMATRRASGLGRGFTHFEDFKASVEEIAKSTTFTQGENVVQLLDLGRHHSWRRGVRAFLAADFTPHFGSPSHDDKTADEVADDFLAWHEAGPEGRPYFAFLNFFDAHDPYRPPERFVEEVADGEPRALDRYDGGIRYIDETMARMLGELARDGGMDNTILIVTSDHGEQFGEHGLDAHGNSLYRQLLHVPLVIVHSGHVPGGVRVKGPVSLRDLAATVLDLTEAPGDSSIGGTSLAAAWREPAGPVSDVIAEVERHYRRGRGFRNQSSPLMAAVDDSVHVIRVAFGALEAFDYRVDPEETRDLVHEGSMTVELQRWLDALTARHKLQWPAASRTGADDDETPAPPGAQR